MGIFWGHGTGECRIFPCQNSDSRVSISSQWTLTGKFVEVSTAIQSLRLTSPFVSCHACHGMWAGNMSGHALVKGVFEESSLLLSQLTSLVSLVSHIPQTLQGRAIAIWYQRHSKVTSNPYYLLQWPVSSSAHLDRMAFYVLSFMCAAWVRNGCALNC